MQAVRDTQLGTNFRKYPTSPTYHELGNLFHVRRGRNVD
ncbi:unnamed protein product [Tenebrio molitor]|nr:unnamed protein product [Tenebrio molitor]